MPATLAFDVYGTLIDPIGITAKLREVLGNDAPRFAQIWRDKQVEYLFRRALMRKYRDFPACTRAALDYTDSVLQTGLSAEACNELMASYRRLPAYADVLSAVQALRSHAYPMFAFSNGHPDDLVDLLRHAGLYDLLDGIVSVHAVRSFKPDPAVYAHFLEKTGADAATTWLVSGNPFDVIGAAACGWQSAWIRRDPAAIFDPWGIEPTVTVPDLGGLLDAI